MDTKKKQDIALMRYSAIAPLITGHGEGYASLSAYFREVSMNGIKLPDGEIKHYASKTIEEWYRNYKRDGFDALIPKGRSDHGKPRKLDDDMKAQIEHFKMTYPRMSASAIYRQLKDSGIIKKGDISESTVNRYVNTLKAKLNSSDGKDMRRYERAHVNEVWCGDTSVGPYLKTGDGKKHKVYIMALIDDASRFVTGIDVFFNDTFVNLMSVMKSAVSKYSIPKMWNFDNGSAYRNKQMELLAARIETTLNYCKPYTPTGKAKIERWFLTLKNQWMATLDMNDFKTLGELRGNLNAYVKKYNQTPHSSLKGKSPQDRYFSEPEHFRRLSSEHIDRSFLLEIERTVSADNVITIDQVEYEVDYRFAKMRIRLRYTPDMDEIFIVESDDTLTPIRLLNKQENAVAKREKVRMSKGDK